MPVLDRRIVVRVCRPSANDFGEVVENITDYPVWAMQVQDRLARNVEVGGVYALGDRVWRVRFNQTFLDAHAAGSTLSVLVSGQADGEDNPDRVTGVGEPDEGRGPHRRRRFLDLMT